MKANRPNKTENLTNPSEVYIKLKYYDQNKSEIGSKTSNLLTTGTNGWTRQIVHIAENEAPINTAYIRPVLVAHDFNGTAYFDAIKLQEGNIKVGYEYNTPAENYVTKITDQKGNIVTFVPDSVGNITKTTDAKGNETSYTYNSFNQLKTVTIPGYDLKTVFEYDKNGNLTTIRNESSLDIYNTTSYVYNKVNQIASVTDPLNKTTNYAYDPSGNLEEINYPTGDSLSYTYDKANRLTEEKYNGAAKYSYTQYDPNGNRKEVKQVIDGSNKTWAFNYDRVERLISVIAPDGSKQENEFDKNSNRTKQTLTINTLSYINQYSYDSSDYPKQLIDHNEKNSYFTYDKSGSLSQQILGNGAVSSYTFDETNLVSKVLNTKSDGSLISSYTYTYDANSNIATVTDNTGKTISYSYDAINQLLSETDPLSTNTFVYQYDNLGNRTKKEVKNGETVINTTTYEYNAGNQLTSINSQSLIYDNNGNLTDDGTKLYTWDAAGRLFEVRNKADNSLIAQYEYDYLGRRIKSTANGVVINYHYDGGSINVLYETDGSNNLTKLYTYSADGMLLSMTKVDGANKTTYYYHYNARGDVVKLTDQSEAEVASYTYDAWGNILSSSGTMAGENPYRYAGYRYDSDINLYYLMARYYNPEIGRFLSKDPIPDAVNDYVYSGNNPVNYVDPTGMVRVEDAGSGASSYKSKTSNSNSYVSGNGGIFYTDVLNYEKGGLSLSGSVIESGIDTELLDAGVIVGESYIGSSVQDYTYEVGASATLIKYYVETYPVGGILLDFKIRGEVALGSAGYSASFGKKNGVYGSFLTPVSPYGGGIYVIPEGPLVDYIISIIERKGN